MEHSRQNVEANNNESQMRFESERLLTFETWPSNSKVEADKIAKAGFIYTGNSQEAKCIWCSCILSSWESGDQVMSRHRSSNPDCPFVQSLSNNIPIESSQESYDSSQSHESENLSIETDTSVESTSTLSSPVEEAISTANETASSEAGILSRYRSEEERLKTFACWPLSFVSPEDLAKSGFIYSGINDSVRCVFCLGYVGSWELGDQPDSVHEDLFPDCNFVRGIDSGNEPLSADRRGQILAEMAADCLNQGQASPRLNGLGFPGSYNEDEGYDETGIRPRHLSPKKEPHSKTSFDAMKSDLSHEHGVVKHRGPVCSKYATLEARLKTFSDWPPALKQTPKDLAEAGFYYIGYSDQVKCFHCDGGLRNWEPHDDPWIEHARWFSQCEFIILMKGEKFISQCLITRPPEVSNGSFDSGCPNEEIEAEIETLKQRSDEHSKSPGASTVLETSKPKLDKSETALPSSSKALDLQEENKRLKEERLCKVCLDNDVGVVFVPCGHLVCCCQCALALARCPLCRETIHGTVRTFLS